MNFSPLIRRILIDLSRAKDPIPAKYRLYHPAGDHVGRNGGKYFDKRKIKRRSDIRDIIRDSPQNKDSLSSPPRVINTDGIFTQSKRKVQTHEGENELTITAYYKLYPEVKAQLENAALDESDIIEHLYRDKKISERVFKRAESGIEIATSAVGNLVGFEGYLPTYLQERSDLLFISQDKTGKTKGACSAVLKDDCVFVDYLGTFGLSGGGSGTALLHEVIAWATANGKDKIILSPLDDAKNFYKKLGFEQIKGDSDYCYNIKELWDGEMGVNMDQLSPRDEITFEEKTRLMKLDKTFAKDMNIDQTLLKKSMILITDPKGALNQDLITLEHVENILNLYSGKSTTFSDIFNYDPLTSKVLEYLRKAPKTDRSTDVDNYLDTCLDDPQFNRFQAFRDVFNKQKIKETSREKGYREWDELNNYGKLEVLERHIAKIFGNSILHGDTSIIGKVFDRYIQGTYKPDGGWFDDYVGSPEFLQFIDHHTEEVRKTRDDPYVQQNIKNYQESFDKLTKKVEAIREYIGMLKKSGLNLEIGMAENIVQSALPDYPEAIKAFEKQVGTNKLDDDKLYADIYDIIMEANI